MTSPRLLVVGHDVTPETVLVQAGTLTTWAADRGVEIVPASVGDGSTGPLPHPRAAGADAVAVLGSPAGAWDDSVGWLAGERAWLDDVLAADVAVLGICFGGQLLARQLGGPVHPGTRGEHGWQEISVERSGAEDAVVPGPWMEFHFDTFTTPPGATRLAVSPRCDQAFRHGRHLGLQFHPEITLASFGTWVQRWTGTELEARLPELGVSTEGLRAETAARAEASRATSWALYDGFAARAGALSGSPARGSARSR